MGTATCMECGKRATKKNAAKIELYDTPWDTVPETAWLHTEEGTAQTCYDAAKCSMRSDQSCLDLLSDTSWADFRYFDCPDCGGIICEQNPRNGWHQQYRYNDNDEQICLKCYQEDILENGISPDKFQLGTLPGMFFSGDNSELIKHGYSLVIEDEFVSTKEDAWKLCKIALDHINNGKKVVVAYESMSIGMIEGYVSLYSAPRT